MEALRPSRHLPTVAHSHAAEPDCVADELHTALAEVRPELLLWFASADRDVEPLAAALGRRFPGVRLAGCTTMGEIGPDGHVDGWVVALALPAPLRAAAELVADLERFRFDEGRPLVQRLAGQLDLEPGNLDPRRHVLVTMTDGLCGMEELLVASISEHAPGVPLVGGSAGDGERFQRTRVGLDDLVRSGAAVVLLLEPGVPFHVFHAHHFDPTEQRVVVTSAEPARRLVRELDGWPAVHVLAQILDIPESQLRAAPQEVLSDRPAVFAFRVGDDWYMRSVMTVQDDALLMGGAVEEGTVLRVMRGGDLVHSTSEALRDAARGVTEPAAMLLFNCGGRMMEARASGLVEALSATLARVPTAGFTTYGEQFGPLQINHTLTGLVLGRPNG